MRRRAVWLSALMLAGALTMTSAAEGAKRKDRCNPKGSRTIVAGLDSRVFLLPRRHGRKLTLTVYGCAFRHRPVRLSRLADDKETVGASVGFPILIGTQVAYVYLRTDTGSSKGPDLAPSVRVMNLHTGRLTRNLKLPKDTRVTDFDAVRPGAVAWMSTTFADLKGQSPSYSVHKLDNSGQTTLDSGQGVLDGSLAISAGTVYWTSGGLPHSASLVRG